MEHEPTVAAYDIARLAGVGKAAVSNWRRRHADFPAPVGGTVASPLYRLAEVEAWLAGHGRAIALRPADVLWQGIRSAVDDLQLVELTSRLGVVLLLAERSPAAWASLAGRPDDEAAAALPAAVRSVLPELPAPLPEGPWDRGWMAIVRQAVDIAGRDGAADTFEYLCERYIDVHARRLVLTAPPVAELMSGLVAGRGTVLDPACGTGGLLLAAHWAGATRLYGQEVDGAIARLAAVRLTLAGAHATIRQADTLSGDAFDDLRVDAVVCNPPTADRAWDHDKLINDPRWEYGLPPRSEPELAWVQHCLARLDVGGRAAVLMPPAAANRRSGRRIRANLLRGGALRAVIRTGAAASAEDLWLLCRPTGRPVPTHLLVIDAGLGADATAGTTTGPGDAITAWRLWADQGIAPAHGRTRAIPIIELLDDVVDVSPRWLAAPIDVDAAAGYAEQDKGVRESAATMLGTIPPLVPTSGPPLATTTLAELLKAGAVASLLAPFRMATDEGPEPVLTARDLRHGRPATGHGHAIPGAVRIRPGDIVVDVTARERTVRVIAPETATGPAALLGAGVLLLRPDPDQLDPYFLAGVLTAAQRHTETPAEITTSRSTFHRIAVPRLPLAEQRSMGAAFAKLMALDSLVHELTERARNLLRVGFAGLATGALRSGEATMTAGGGRSGATGGLGDGGDGY